MQINKSNTPFTITLKMNDTSQEYLFERDFPPFSFEVTNSQRVVSFRAHSRD